MASKAIKTVALNTTIELAKEYARSGAMTSFDNVVYFLQQTYDKLIALEEDTAKSDSD